MDYPANFVADKCVSVTQRKISDITVVVTVRCASLLYIRARCTALNRSHLNLKHSFVYLKGKCQIVRWPAVWCLQGRLLKVHPFLHILISLPPLKQCNEEACRGESTYTTV